MKPLHLIPIALALSSCGPFVAGFVNTAGASVTEPMQIGDHKYKILYKGHIAGQDVGVYESKAIPLAQSFCNKSGFDHAEVSYSGPNEYIFFCMNPGDRISSRPDHLIIENR